jgi:hypothetical protein
MKSTQTKYTKKVLTGIVSSVVLITAAYASLVLPPYDKSKPPSLSLPAAYEIAMKALGPATNQFHCISAMVTTQFAVAGEWYFTFYSANSNSPPKFIAIKFNGEVVFDSGLR